MIIVSYFKMTLMFRTFTQSAPFFAILSKILSIFACMTIVKRTEPPIFTSSSNKVMIYTRKNLR
eukprot:UN13604